MTKISTIIQSILAKLAAEQRSSGAFSGVSVQGENIVSSSALFGTALTATILAELADDYLSAHTMCSWIIPYLATQEHADGSFSYWERGSFEEQTQPYPPDLDDTALAAAGMIRINSGHCDGIFLARIVKLLTKAEIAEGGPYNTWLVEGVLNPESPWIDIDCAVNANIAYMLSLLDIELPALSILFDTAITTDTYESRYYHSPLMILFFISRSYRGEHREKAITYILNLKQEDETWGTTTETALALCALSNFGADISSYEAPCAILTAAATTELALDPLYREHITDEAISFYANQSVSRSLIALALHRFDQSTKKVSDTSTPSSTVFEEQMVATFISHCSAAATSFGENARTHAIALLEEPISKDAVLLPLLFSKLLNTNTAIPINTIESLSQAHLFGWIGYRIIDEIMDGERDAAELPFAIFCIRSFTSIYRVLLPDTAYTSFSDVMNNTEYAFKREYQERLQKNEDGYSLATLSDQEPVTWQKSLGHALPALVLILLSGYSIDSEAYESTKSFFTALLHARQLHDDAHDFIEDLGFGRVTVVGMRVLRRFMELYPDRSTYTLPADEQELRRLFWHDCFPPLYKEINDSIDDARHHLYGLPIRTMNYFENLLATISSAQKRAYNERARMMTFLETY